MLLTGSLFSQSIGVFGGYGSSAYGDDFADDFDQAKYIPVGAFVLFGSGSSFEIGGEINYAVTPFTFESEFGDLKLNQLYYGALAKFKFGSGRGILPYVRGGAGLYTGTMEFDFSDEANAYGLEDAEFDLKNAFGFNVGGGIEIGMRQNDGFFAEFVYHIVDRELGADDTEQEENESFSANNWAIHVGVSFGL